MSSTSDEVEETVDKVQLQEHVQTEGERALRTTLRFVSKHLSAQRIMEVTKEETA